MKMLFSIGYLKTFCVQHAFTIDLSVNERCLRRDTGFYSVLLMDVIFKDF